MARKKQKVGTQHRLDILIESLKDFQWEDGHAVLKQVIGNNNIDEPYKLIITLHNVRLERSEKGIRAVLVEYATNDATNEEYIIWWTSQEDCNKQDSFISDDVPDYIVNQFNSRLGRNGRGRLWVDPDIPVETITVDEQNEIAKIADNCGGVVIHKCHYDYVKNMPGFVTDLELNMVTS